MAWIACHCQCGCKKYKCVDPKRTTNVSPGLCDHCKQAGHFMINDRQGRRMVLAQAYVSVVTRKQLIVGLTDVVKR